MERNKTQNLLISQLVKAHQMINIAIEEAKRKTAQEQHQNRQLLKHIYMIDIELLQIITLYTSNEPVSLEILFEDED